MDLTLPIPVIPSAARNLFLVSMVDKESRFLAALGMTGGGSKGVAQPCFVSLRFLRSGTRKNRRVSERRETLRPLLAAVLEFIIQHS